MIDPSQDGIVPPADTVDGEGSGPEIVCALCHGSESPIAFRIVTIEQARSNVVVTVGEDHRRDGNLVSEDPANRMSAPIDLGRNVFNDDARAALRRLDQTRPSGARLPGRAANEIVNDLKRDGFSRSMKKEMR
jgi:hypothetical protein